MTIANDLVSFYLGLYNTGKVSLMLLFTTGVAKEVFLSTYRSFVNDEILVSIESLPTEEKLKLVSECRETGLNFSNETLINSAKILHTIKFINANS
jgi:hypothetical protein